MKWIDSRKKNGNDFSKQESPALQQKINGEPCPLYIAGSKISRNFSTAINKYVSGSIARNYWSDNKQSFGEGSFDVELSATDDAMKSIPMPRQHWLTKHTSGFNEEGKNMLRRKEWTQPSAQMRTSSRKSEHVIKCRGAGGSIKELEKWMKNKSTAANITVQSA